MGGHHHHVQPRLQGPQALESLQAVDAGEPQVEQHEIRFRLRQDGEGLLYRADVGDAVAALPQQHGEDAPDRPFVVDDQDAGHGSPSIRGRRIEMMVPTPSSLSN